MAGEKSIAIDSSRLPSNAFEKDGRSGLERQGRPRIMGRMENGRKTLADQTAVVTGGARRLGAAIAWALAAEGARVVVGYRASAAEAEALAQEIGGVAVRGELGTAAGRAAFWEAASSSAGGKINIWVNNAGRFVADDAGMAALLEMHEVNEAAGLDFARRMMANGGAIIQILDSRVLGGPGEKDRFRAYTEGKRRMAEAIASLAREGLASGTRINGVAPGDVLPPEHCHEKAAPAPLDRPAPEDVARAVAYLAGARSITGQILAVDGGRWLAHP